MRDNKKTIRQQFALGNTNWGANVELDHIRVRFDSAATIADIKALAGRGVRLNGWGDIGQVMIEENGATAEYSFGHTGLSLHGFPVLVRANKHVIEVTGIEHQVGGSKKRVVLFERDSDGKIIREPAPELVNS